MGASTDDRAGGTAWAEDDVEAQGRPGAQDVRDAAALLERAADFMERAGRPDVAASHRRRARGLRDGTA